MDKRIADVGRLTVVPLATFLGAGNVVTVIHDMARVSTSDPASVLRPVAGALVVAFYGLVVLLYLRRGRPTETTRSTGAKLAAGVGSWLPLALPYAWGRSGSATTLLAAMVLLTAGMAWAVVSLRTLGRSFSIVPQARAVVQRGPYTVVRHPLYLGELTAALGVVLRAPSGLGLSLWVALVALQGYRTHHEERVLMRALPDYDRYRQATRWRIIPGIL